MLHRPGYRRDYLRIEMVAKEIWRKYGRIIKESIKRSSRLFREEGFVVCEEDREIRGEEGDGYVLLPLCEKKTLVRFHTHPSVVKINGFMGTVPDEFSRNDIIGSMERKVEIDCIGYKKKERMCLKCITRKDNPLWDRWDEKLKRIDEIERELDKGIIALGGTRYRELQKKLRELYGEHPTSEEMLERFDELFEVSEECIVEEEKEYRE